MTPVLSILIPTVPERLDLFERLLDSLHHQDCSEPVEILTNDQPGPSGTKRQKLLNSARGEFVAFIDDDDRVSGDYLSQLCEAIRSSEGQADIISFDLQRHVDGVPADVWSLSSTALDDEDAIGSTAKLANHLCAWRRSIAARVPFCPVGYGDDQLWYRAQHMIGGATVRHVPRVLYHYCFHRAITINQRNEVYDETRRWVDGGVRLYRLPDEGVYGVSFGGECDPRDPVDLIIAGGERAVAPRSLLVDLGEIRVWNGERYL